MRRNKKHLAHIQQNPLVLLLVGCVLVGVAYAGFVWATDTGKILAYALFCFSAYYSARVLAHAVKQLIRK
jgi:uncharacterized membrane protein